MGIEGTLTEVLALVGRFAPTGAAVSAEQPLVGAGGLGFDSVRLVELLLACEDRFGVSLEVDQLAAERGLSAAGIAGAIDAARDDAGHA